MEHEIRQSEQRKSDPDPVVAAKTAEAVTKRAAHRIKKHYQRISAAKPKQRIDALHALPHLSESRIWSDSVMEEWSNENHAIASVIIVLLDDSP